MAPATSETSPCPVLVVGAGPSGLLMALWLARLGVKGIRIIDKSTQAGLTSRATIVHARILEHYRQLGIADEFVTKGTIVTRTAIRENGILKGTMPFGHLGVGQSPFPFMLIFHQDAHERVLISHLEAAGVKVERQTELVQLEQQDSGVNVTLRRKDGSEETFAASYVAGCDGAHSTVRQLSAIDMPGGTYDHRFFVADVEAEGDAAKENLNVCLSGLSLCLVLPMVNKGQVRLTGLVPPHLEQNDISFEDVRADVEGNTKLTIHKVNWFSTYRIHHRVANKFQDRRVFICGDAGHLHSPVGGQGMNTGLGDASNLAWKLASVLSGRASEALLDTYGPDRQPFARLLTNTTDYFFTLTQDPGWSGLIVRRIVLPYILPFMFKFPYVGAMGFQRLSQIMVNYRPSPLSQGAAGSVHAGDRLPWVQMGDFDNLMCLRDFDWQIHVYGTVDHTIRKVADAHSLMIQSFPWTNAAANKGLVEDALYLIRPDGYVGFADTTASVTMLSQYLDDWAIRGRVRTDVKA